MPTNWKPRRDYTIAVGLALALVIELMAACAVITGDGVMNPRPVSTCSIGLVNGVKMLVTGIAALVMAIIAAVSTIVGVTSKVMAEVLAQVAGFAH